jgi:GT2 family glycosyltransferase
VPRVPVLHRLVSRFTGPVGRHLTRRREARKIRAILERASSLAAVAATSVAEPAGSEVLLSIVVPAFDSDVGHLRDLIGSFRAQTTTRTELVIVDDASAASGTRAYLAALDDPRISVIHEQVNLGIAGASNRGIMASRGRWVAFVDHDDVLVPHALDHIVATLDRHPECQMLYTDEVRTDPDLNPLGIFLKPAWDPVLASGVNYVNHLSCYRRDRLVAIGCFRAGFDGSQDYDLLLRFTHGLSTDEVLHLPFPAYLWRAGKSSFSARFADQSVDHARKAISQYFDDTPVSPAHLPFLHRVRFDEKRTDWPMVSVIIPSLESPGLIATVLAGVLTATDYPELEVIVVDNGSTSRETLAVYDRFRSAHPNLTVSIVPEPFNFSRAINRGVAMASGDVLLLLNNDIEVIEPFWLREMVSCLAYDGVGIVGAKLLYPDRSIQHAGVIAGFGGYAGHWFLRAAADFSGPMGRLAVRQSFTVVTGACVLVTRDAFRRIGPFDHERFEIAYNDVDFCLRAVKAGIRVMWTPFATLVHRESASRGSDDVSRNAARFGREKANLRAAHRTDRIADPATNPWYTTDRSYPSLRLLDALPPARTARLGQAM